MGQNKDLRQNHVLKAVTNAAAGLQKALPAPIGSC